MSLIALDVALLLPPDIAARAIALSATLGGNGITGVRLDETHLPHITLVQQFVDERDLDVGTQRIAAALRGVAPLPLSAAGGGKGRSSVWIAVAPSPPLRQLHARVLDALGGLDRPRGSRNAFYGRDARVGDVAWVAAFRHKASGAAFTPHVTIGHASTPPRIEPFDFTGDVVAACHLGRFCTCRRVFREWSLRTTA